MKPLRDLVLIQQKSTYKEEKTDGGLYVVSGEASNYNFKAENESTAEILQKINPTKNELIGKLVEFNRKKNGKHYDFHPASAGDSSKLGALEKNERLKDIIFGRKGNIGVIVDGGDGCKYFGKDDCVIFRKNSNYNYDLRGIGEDLILVEEKDILVKKEGDSYFVHPDYVIVKISKESRDDVFRRKLKNDKGEEIILFLPTHTEKSDANHSEYFVTCGEIYGVGSNVKNVNIGDTAILDYRTDNDDEIIIGYEGEDKLIVTTAITTRHEDELVVYANQRSRRDQIVHSKDDYLETCQLLGVIRNGELFPRDPFVFLHHESTIVNKKTASGITYTVDEKIIKRQILAISEESKKRCGLQAGEWVVMDDFDLFSITLEDRKISAINDIDIMCPAETLVSIKEKLLALKES